MSVQSIKFTYRGLIAPVFTPFNDDPERTVNLSIIKQYSRYLVDKNIEGVLVNGTSGEGPSLTVQERKQVAEAWRDAVKETKQHLMVQVGGAAFTNVLELAAHAESIGVDSILCLPELYFKPKSIDELIDYLKKVGSAAPNTPLLYYHIPMLTDVILNMGEFLETVGNQIPNFVGIKFTSSDLVEGMRAMRANPKDFAVFLGNDGLIFSAAHEGMDSFILTSLNFIPEYALNILKYREGKENESNARNSQKIIADIVDVITKHGSWVESMKAAFSLLSPKELNMGPPRYPLKACSKKSVDEIKQNLGKLLHRTI